MSIQSSAKRALHSRRTAGQCRQERLDRDAAMTDVEWAERRVTIITKALERQKTGKPCCQLQPVDKERVKRIVGFITCIRQTAQRERLAKLTLAQAP